MRGRDESSTKEDSTRWEGNPTHFLDDPNTDKISNGYPEITVLPSYPIPTIVGVDDLIISRKKSTMY